MSVLPVFNIDPFDVSGDLDSRGHLRTRDQRHYSATPLIYVPISKRTEDTRLKLWYCATRIGILSLLGTFVAAAMWLLPPAVVAASR